MGGSSAASRGRLIAVPSVENAKSIESLARWLDCNTRHDVGGQARDHLQLRRVRAVAIALLVGIDRRARDLRRFGLTAGDVTSCRSRGTSLFSRGARRTSRSSLYHFPWPPCSTPRAAGTGGDDQSVQGPARMIGLWAKDSWWEKAGTIPLPIRSCLRCNCSTRKGQLPVACRRGAANRSPRPAKGVR